MVTPWVCLALFTCLVFAAWIYWPGQSGAYILDDQSSLLPLERLAESPELFEDFVYGDRSGRLGRSVSMLTFSLEKIFTDGSVATLKRHSILLHVLIATLVFWLAYLLCQALEYPRPAWLALLAMAVWLFAPQQTSTVLYSVQRMAMLATLFVLLALVFYLKARAALGVSRSAWLWLALSGLSAGLAPFAKENGILAVPLIIVIEATLLRGRLVDGRSWTALRQGAWLLMGVGVVFVFAYFFLNFEQIKNGYDRRSFTLGERLLTQPVILWDYVTQFYWPDLSRLGVFHDDFPVSSSLTASSDAALALAGWLLLLAIALLCAWYGVAWIVPGLLFFFLGAHSLESGFFALELYFEHRNYLPSVALALLPAFTAGEIGRRWPALTTPLIAWGGIAVLALALKTVSQVQIWSSPTLLALHHLNGHPDSVRANTDMATRLAGLGDYDAALEFSTAGFNASQTQKAARLERAGDFHLRNIALACMAGITAPREQLNALGLEHPNRPIGDTNTLEVIVKLQRENRCPRFGWHLLADRLEVIYLSDPAPGRASVGVYTALSVFMNALERMQSASHYAALALAQQPDNAMLNLMQLHFTTALGKVGEASSLKQKLQALQAAGKLTVADQQTLALYLE
ncbi:ArnT family glycosyltransferase [Kineobactrum sediminis]|nr:hypothetical protein [Kineobactrum sediminis]